MARPQRPTPQPHIADGARHPRVIWAVSESEGASQKPFDGDPYTRLARTRCGRARDIGHRCVGFKALGLRYSALISSIRLRAIAAKILELFRSADQPPLAELPFFVGCRRVTQAVDFPTCHFRCFHSFPGTRSCPLGARKPQLDKPADGFGARWMVLL